MTLRGSGSWSCECKGMFYWSDSPCGGFLCSAYLTLTTFGVFWVKQWSDLFQTPTSPCSPELKVKLAYVTTLAVSVQYVHINTENKVFYKLKIIVTENYQQLAALTPD